MIPQVIFPSALVLFGGYRNKPEECSLNLTLSNPRIEVDAAQGTGTLYMVVRTKKLHLRAVGRTPRNPDGEALAQNRSAE